MILSANWPQICIDLRCFDIVAASRTQKPENSTSKLRAIAMTVSATSTRLQPISIPHTKYLPETDSSRAVILEPYHVDLLPEYGYVSREFLISGVAAGEAYCTRLLLRCPSDVARFTGFVVMEPSHLWGGTSIWRHINRWLMRNDELLIYTI